MPTPPMSRRALRPRCAAYAATGYRLWSDEYDREPKDLLAVQDEIAAAIAGALRVTLGRRADAGAVSPVRAEAHDLYLRGAYFRSRLSRADLAKAVAYFDRAIALDSTYALAYAGKASALAPGLYFRHPAPPAEFAEYLRREVATWGKIVRENGIKAN